MVLEKGSCKVLDMQWAVDRMNEINNRPAKENKGEYVLATGEAANSSPNWLAQREKLSVSTTAPLARKSVRVRKAA